MSSNVVSITNAVLDAALEYAARGWPVFPCEPRGKKPLTAHGFKDASTLPDVIRSWWKRYPRANVAVPTGARTFDVLDIDGPTGERSLAELEAKHEELPIGPRQQTGTGRHILFTGGTLGVSARRLPGLDTRGEGGYVVMAPSIHSSGERYALEDADEPIPAPPAWLVQELRAGARQALEPFAGEPIRIDDDAARILLGMAGVPLLSVAEGRRNDQLFRWGASLRARGMELEFVLHVLRTANRLLCQPPLGDVELVRIAQSAAKLEVAAAYRRGEEVTAKHVEQAAEEFAFEQEVREAPNEAHDESLEALRTLLRIPLLGVEKRGPDYYLVLEDELRLRVKNLLAFDEIERAVFDTLGVLPAVKRKHWRAAASRLRAIARELDPGLSSERDATLHYLESFLRDKRSEIAEDEDQLCSFRVTGEPVIRFGSEFWFLFDAFSSYCAKVGLREPVGLLWRRIRETGCLREEKTLRHGGRHYTRRYWVVGIVILGGGEA